MAAPKAKTIAGYIVIAISIMSLVWAKFLLIRLILRRIKHNPSNMSPSSRLANKIKEFEGFKLTSYQDPGPKHNWTVGYGHNLSAQGPYNGQPIESTTITADEADELLKDDLDRHAQAVRDSVSVNLNQDQFDALADVAFGIGVNGFKKSNLLNLVNNGANAADIAQELLTYTNSDDKYMKGLDTRAQYHAKLYTLV